MKDLSTKLEYLHREWELNKSEPHYAAWLVLYTLMGSVERALKSKSNGLISCGAKKKG
jgi:hypothetical protein